MQHLGELEFDPKWNKRDAVVDLAKRLERLDLLDRFGCAERLTDCLAKPDDDLHTHRLWSEWLKRAVHDDRCGD